MTGACLIALCLATSASAQPPKMKMTTPIPASITAPDKAETSIGTLEYFEAVTAWPSMTVPKPGKTQAYIGKFEDENGERLKGGQNYVIHINGPVPVEIFWPVVIYDTDTRCLIDNRKGAAGGKATVGSKIPGLRQNPDGSFYMPLGPDAPPKGWEANYVQTLPGRGWFPYMRAYGAKDEFFKGQYKYPTVNKVKDFSEYFK
jgi:hypothetical protein